MFKFLAFVSSILIGSVSVSALDHPMSDKEYAEFIGQMETIIRNYIIANRKSLKSIKDNPTALSDYIANYFSKRNDEFDREHGFDISDPDLTHCTKTFEDVAKLYYDHVLDYEAFAKKPLCCRGVSLFVLKYLKDRGIKCRYVQIRSTDPSSPTLREAHAIVTYFRDGQWYVCDPSRALSIYIVENYASACKRSLCRETYGYTYPRDFLSIPCTDYQKRFVLNPKYTTIFAVQRARIDRTGWHPFEYDRIKGSLACETLDHFNHYDEMATEELRKYCGLSTLEELKDKSPDELLELYKAQSEK